MNLFFGVISYNLLHLKPLKRAKKNAICLKLCTGTRCLFIEN